MAKQVLIIGAGPSGLAAIKEMKTAGFDVICLEKANDIGGVFRVSKDWSYDEMYLTISNFYMAYSDFPPLEKQIRYSKKDDYFRYLQAYSLHFDLKRYIQFETTVVSAKLTTAMGKWHIKAQCKGKMMEYTPDTLIVATGSNHSPHVIETPGFTGQTLHS